MAWVIGGSSEYFSRDGEKAKSNAIEIFNFFSSRGWTKQAIAGLLGNTFRESTNNPNLIEIGGTGHGLVQWTPPSNLYDVLDKVYGGHTDWSDGAKQCGALYAEFQQSTGEKNWGIEGQWYTTSAHPESWKEWSESTGDPGDLAVIFMANYERPGVPAEQERRDNAAYFYDVIRGLTPGTGGNGKNLDIMKKGNILYNSSGVFYKASNNLWISNQKYSSNGSGGIGTGSEIQNALANAMRSLADDPKIIYSQALRYYNLTPYSDGNFYGDCSSLCVELYEKYAGLKIGSYTGDMNPGYSKVVDITDNAPDENNLKPGDLLFFGYTKIGRVGFIPSVMPGTDGHVEMYVGNGQCAGHGSGIGPRYHDIKTYGPGRVSSGYSPYAGSVSYVD